MQVRRIQSRSTGARQKAADARIEANALLLSHGALTAINHQNPSQWRVEHGDELPELFRVQPEDHLIEQHRMRAQVASSMNSHSQKYAPNAALFQ